MNTQSHVHRLQAGEALSLPANGTGRVILAEGEVLVQSPARWLAGTVVFSPAVRLSAPMVLNAEQAGSVVAASEASLVVEESPSVLAGLASLVRRVARSPKLQHA